MIAGKYVECILHHLRDHLFRYGISRNANIIGCYLAAGLPYVRHSADVIRELRWTLVEMLFDFKVGPFSAEEDELILEFVKNNDNTLETWGILTHKLNRLQTGAIYTRYHYLISSISHRTENWEVEEDVKMARILFKVIITPRISKIK